jgi:hypothetical protein
MAASSKFAEVWATTKGLGSRLLGALALLASYGNEYPIQEGAFHVRPPGDIQGAIELAAQDPTTKRVVVHAGTYRPNRKGQALIWLNHRHDGLVIEARGEVILTAQNREIADPAAESFPAVVNHVVYFGDGISRRTVLRGFTITGANNFVTDLGGPKALEPNFDELRKTEGFYRDLFFFTDGGAIKIFGRSYPVIDGVQCVDNFSSPCAGGISIEHRGLKENSALLTNCIFRGNRALVTGSAVDLLPGSSAEIKNCLFVGNISNSGESYHVSKGNINWTNILPLIATTLRYQPQHGSGALTVFPNSRVRVERCTFTANFNGADDKGFESVYERCIFWRNAASGGLRKGGRYEMDLARSTVVRNCFLNGNILDLANAIDPRGNHLECPDPEFDGQYNPRNAAFVDVGWRPANVVPSGRDE